MNRLVQICLWYQGVSLHDYRHNDCVPDFSCCRPELLAQREEREMYLIAYVTGDALTEHRMLVMFLGRLAKDSLSEEDPEEEAPFY